MPFMKERTHTADALRVMREDIFNPRNGDREDARNVAIVFTDGNSNINEENTVPTAIQVKKTSTVMFSKYLILQ